DSEKEPRVDDEEADVQRALEESLKSMYNVPSPVDRYIFQRCTSTPTGSFGYDESSSLYAELGLTDNEEESKEDVSGADARGKGEGQARPDPDPGNAEASQPMPSHVVHTGSDCEYIDLDVADVSSQPPLEQMDEWFTATAYPKAGPDPGNAEASQPMPSPVVHTGSDCEYIDLDVADVSSQPPLEQMDEGFTATAYPKVQKNLKLTVEEQVILEEPASSLGTLSSLQHLTKDLSFETEAESMVSVTIQQDMSLIPPMTTSIIDLTSRPKSPKGHQQLKETATETTTTILPPPSKQQQSTTDAMMMKRIDELEHIMVNLIQENKRLEKRMDSNE
nr:hypothetical protein [Tanacetum cinerariifolium]